MLTNQLKEAAFLLHLPRNVRRRIVYATVVTLMAGGLALSVRSGKETTPVAVALPEAKTTGLPHTNDPMPIPDDIPVPAAAMAAAPAPTEAPKPRPKIETYTVVEGDTVGGIAEKFGLSSDTILWANDMGADDYLQIGQELKIPAVDGVVHVVESGDNLWDLSDSYGVDFTLIAEANPDVDASALQLGEILIIPGAEPRLRRAGMVASRGGERVSTGGALSRWPAYGPLTDDFGWRTHPVYGTAHFHDGIDVGIPTGTPVVTVAPGRVTYAGWLGGYGLTVKVDHGDGIVTLYAHLDQVSVETGQSVDGGEQIGLSGNTGVSTGPHLHFSLFVGGSPVDPIGWLP